MLPYRWLKHEEGGNGSLRGAGFENDAAVRDAVWFFLVRAFRDSPDMSFCECRFNIRTCLWKLFKFLKMATTTAAAERYSSIAALLEEYSSRGREWRHRDAAAPSRKVELQCPLRVDAVSLRLSPPFIQRNICIARFPT